MVVLQHRARGARRGTRPVGRAAAVEAPHARAFVRALLRLSDAQVIAVADPAESFSLERFYYKGEGGRWPVRAEIEKSFSGDLTAEQAVANAEKIVVQETGL